MSSTGWYVLLGLGALVVSVIAGVVSSRRAGLNLPVDIVGDTYVYEVTGHHTIEAADVVSERTVVDRALPDGTGNAA